MKLRFLIFFAAIFLFAGILSGCSSREQVQESPELETAAPTEDPHAGQILVSDGYGSTMWVDEAEELTPFSMDLSAFSVSGSTASYAGDDYTLDMGIDVSDHQGVIDWQQVAASGVEFAVIRCAWRGYSGGSLNEDSYFRQNIEGAKAAGLKVGVYFFSQATSIVEAAEEALYTIDLLSGYTIDLPVFFDWEFIGVDDARTNDVPGEVVTAACLEFCRLIEDAGYDSGVYAYLNLAYNTYDLNQLKDTTIWMGDPGSAPEFYYEHQYWQYSFTGVVPGIEGDVDMDVIFNPTAPQIVNVSSDSTESEVTQE